MGKDFDIARYQGTITCCVSARPHLRAFFQKRPFSEPLLATESTFKIDDSGHDIECHPIMFALIAIRMRHDFEYFDAAKNMFGNHTNLRKRCVVDFFLRAQGFIFRCFIREF